MTDKKRQYWEDKAAKLVIEGRAFDMAKVAQIKTSDRFNAATDKVTMRSKARSSVSDLRTRK